MIKIKLAIKSNTGKTLYALKSNTDCAYKLSARSLTTRTKNYKVMNNLVRPPCWI